MPKKRKTTPNSKVPADDLAGIEDAAIYADDDNVQSPLRRDILKVGSAAALGSAFLAATRHAHAQALYAPDPPAEVPDWYNTSSENLSPGERTSDYYVPSTEKDANVDWWFGRNVGGVTIGLIQARAHLPMAPGNMGNATTFDFPLLYREAVPPICPL